MAQSEASGDIRIFAPATVGNVACGFDVLGLALDAPGDVVSARIAPRPGVEIVAIHGDGGRLPRDADSNTASLAARAVLRAAGADSSRGVALSITKGLPLSGGMGGSAASAVAAAVAVNGLLALGLARPVLLQCAAQGEAEGAGASHLDNVAPCLYGGICLALNRGEAGNVPTVVGLPIPEGLSVALVHPRLEVNTRDARAVLGSRVSLEDAVVQWGNTAGFVAALFRGDLDLLARTVVDRIAEPVRKHGVPGFDAVRAAALDTGALAVSLSGAGPSVFALAAELETAETAGRAMVDAFADAGVEATLHLSPVSSRGARAVQGDSRNPNRSPS